MQVTITDWLEKTSIRLPAKVAFYEENKKITFKEMMLKSKAVACAIHLKGVINQPIAVYMRKGIDEIVSFLGIAYSRNFYCPIDVSLPEARVDQMLNVLKPKVIITSKDCVEIVSKQRFEGELLVYDDILKDNFDYSILENINNRMDNDLLYVLFTSGSTGVPKGVCVTHRNVMNYIDWVVDKFEFDESDSIGNQAPFFFDHSIFDIYTTIKTGATCYIIPKRLFSQPLKLLEFLRDNRVNTIFWVPFALCTITRFRALNKIDLSGILKRVISGGDVMPTKDLLMWKKNIPNAVCANMYGPTETTGDITYFVLNREIDENETIPIGNAIANTKLLVLNSDDRLVEVGEIGELCVCGASVAAGYYNSPEITQKSFVLNPVNPQRMELMYKTGDLVRYNEHGELVYISRKDFQIKHLGHRIELGEIEAAAYGISEVDMVACTYDKNQSLIVLFAITKLAPEYIKDRLSQVLPHYMLPSKIIVLDEMPINANGKIDKSKLMRMYGGLK